MMAGIMTNKNFVHPDTVEKLYRYTQDAITWYWAQKFDQRFGQMWLDADQQFQEVIDDCGLNNPKAVISARRRTQDSGTYKITEGRVCAVMLNNDYQSDWGGGLTVGNTHCAIEGGTVVRYQNQTQLEQAPDHINIVQTILYVYET